VDTTTGTAIPFAICKNTNIAEKMKCWFFTLGSVSISNELPLVRFNLNAKLMTQLNIYLEI